MTGLPPDVSQQSLAMVDSQRMLATDTYAIRLHCPEIAARIVPGQFFMIRPASGSDPLLGRPFALYDTYEDDDGNPAGVEFGYVTVGKLTQLMTEWTGGESVEIWGPLGNGFPLVQCNHLMFVAGGIGQTPFLATAMELLQGKQYAGRSVDSTPDRISMCYGVRSAEYLGGLDDFAAAGLQLQIATDDGTQGHAGFVTELLSESLVGENPPDCVFCCGPEPMMSAVARICAASGVECWLSLETPMACGFGACFSCVTRVRMDDGSWDYKRVCVEGPVFRAECLVHDDT